MRLRLAEMLDNLDTYSYVFDPYVPGVVESQLSDDLTSIASDLETGLRHYREGDVAEALWWWQFSYVSSWGNLAGVSLNALLSVVAHDRLDAEFTGEDEDVAAANEMLDEGEPLSTSGARSRSPRIELAAPRHSHVVAALGRRLRDVQLCSHAPATLLHRSALLTTRGSTLDRRDAAA